MDYVLAILIGILTVGYMWKHHIEFVSPDNDIESEDDEVGSVDWGNGKL